MICPKCGKENDPSFRQCASCGTFLPDASNPEFSDTKQHDVQMQFAQPAPEQSRYQEYTMSDVAAKKSHKTLIIWLIIIAAVIALGVATFFIIKAVVGGGKNSKDIQSDPTAYVFGSYQTVAQELTDGNNVIKTAISAPNGQKTVKTTISSNDFSNITVYSVDSDARKLYYSQKADYSANAFGGYAPLGFSAELLVTPEKAVAKSTSGGKSVDYFLNLENLRENAAASAFGPDGENPFHIDRAAYDMAMDIYEFVYDNIFKNSDPFALSTLGQKLKNDFDTCGNITVTDEKVTIDGTEVNAHVVSHTFTNTDIVTAVIDDVKSWIKDMTSFNDQISKLTEEAIAKIDPSALVSQISAQGPFELSFKHYINDNDQLMKAEIRFSANGMGAAVVLNLGADPTNSKQMTLTVSTSVSGQGEMTLETITMKNESTDAQDKFVVSLSGLAVMGEITYTRDIASGDFTIKGNLQNPMSGMTKSSILPENSQQNNSNAFEFSGNLKTENDGTVTLTYTQELYDGSELKYQISTSPTAVIPDLTSQNDILKASASELIDSFNGLFKSIVPSDPSILTPPQAA